MLSNGLITCISVQCVYTMVHPDLICNRSACHFFGPRTGCIHAPQPVMCPTRPGGQGRGKHSLPGGDPAHRRQSAQEMPFTGQHVIAPQALPTLGPHLPVLHFKDPALRRQLLRIIFLGAMKAEHASDKAWVHHHRGLSPGSGHMRRSRHVSTFAGKKQLQSSQCWPSSSPWC